MKLKLGKELTHKMRFIVRANKISLQELARRALKAYMGRAIPNREPLPAYGGSVIDVDALGMYPSAIRLMINAYCDDNQPDRAEMERAEAKELATLRAYVKEMRMSYMGTRFIVEES
jgi:hypothetical protein